MEKKKKNEQAWQKPHLFLLWNRWCRPWYMVWELLGGLGGRYFGLGGFETFISLFWLISDSSDWDEYFLYTPSWYSLGLWLILSISLEIPPVYSSFTATVVELFLHSSWDNQLMAVFWHEDRFWEGRLCWADPVSEAGSICCITGALPKCFRTAGWSICCFCLLLTSPACKYESAYPSKRLKCKLLLQNLNNYTEKLIEIYVSSAFITSTKIIILKRTYVTDQLYACTHAYIDHYMYRSVPVNFAPIKVI